MTACQRTIKRKTNEGGTYRYHAGRFMLRIDHYLLYKEKSGSERINNLPKIMGSEFQPSFI